MWWIQFLLTNCNRRDRPITNDHPEGPTYCKWSSKGTGLLQMIIRHPRQPTYLCQDTDSISQTFLEQFVLGGISACRLEFWINWAAFLKSSICEVPSNWLKIEPPYPCQLILMKMSFCIYALRGVKKKVSGVPLNSYILVQYKIFGLKHFIVFVKKASDRPKLLFDPPHENAKFQSCSTIGLWGVYPEVLRAHAQKSPFFLILL